jgi:predicted metal-binding membrane protein
MNLVHLSGVDGTDPDSMTRGEVEGRRQAMLAIEALRRFMPGCKGVRLRNFGMTIGIRDTRKIDAICNMTEADVRNEGRFKDTLGIYPEFIDGYGILIIPTTGRTMHIPYRSMLPKGVKGLLVAGRAIGGDMVAHAATRNMACCAVEGQGAGVAAAQAVKSNRDLDGLDMDAIQHELMLPSFVPALRTFLHVGAAGATRPTEAAALIAGYALVWIAGAIIGALGQMALARAGLVAPHGASLSLWLSAALLLVAGLYQFTHLKAACLARCRMPLTFFMERRAPGSGRAFRMGLGLGILCFGCWWALMALAFVGGTMNLIWMGAATLFMVMEKLPDLGRVLTRPAGYLLLFAAGTTALLAVIS